MSTKPEAFRSSPWMLLAVPCLIVGVLACACLSLGLAAVETTGDIVLAPLRWLSPPQPDNLHALLRENGDGTFTLATGCELHSAEGQIITSQPDAGQGGNFSAEIPRPEVVKRVLESIQSDIYMVSEGRPALSTGTPVAASLAEEEGVSLYFTEEDVTSTGVTTRSIDGVIRQNSLRGSYSLEENISTVQEGQGVEEVVNLMAEFTCPLDWLP